jgi:MSHA biogenesis protein MshN
VAKRGLGGHSFSGGFALFIWGKLMSLLNDMLRDLSQHKPVADGAEGYDEALLQTSSIARKNQQSWMQLALVFIFIFVAVLSVNYVIHKFSTNPKSVSVHKDIPVVRPATPSAPVTAAASSTRVATVVKPVDVKIETVEPVDENAAQIELQNHITDLLQQADRAFGMDRLTSPVEDNAYGYYQKILSMSATNLDAKEGLDKIADRYLIKAQEQVQLGNISQAEALVQRARFVSARFVQAHEISMSGTVNQSATELAARPTADMQIPHQPSQTSIASTAPAAPTETIKPFVVAEAPMVSVSPNAGWKDEQLARHAQELIQQGKQTEAQALLKTFIAAEQKPALSSALLADLYIQQGNTQAAEIIVEKTNYLTADVKAKLKAQILSANGDDAQAITVLEQSLNTADANEGYRSLLASLYHKTANYQQSIISYQRLMNSFGEKPAYWLGLALAYDGLSQHKSALQAYQHVREYPQLQEQVKKYTDQRIAALRSE